MLTSCFFYHRAIRIKELSYSHDSPFIVSWISHSRCIRLPSHCWIWLWFGLICTISVLPALTYMVWALLFSNTEQQWLHEMNTPLLLLNLDWCGNSGSFSLVACQKSSRIQQISVKFLFNKSGTIANYLLTPWLNGTFIHWFIHLISSALICSGSWCIQCQILGSLGELPKHVTSSGFITWWFNSWFWLVRRCWIIFNHSSSDRGCTVV